jgi:hypothetical protein
LQLLAQSEQSAGNKRTNTVLGNHSKQANEFKLTVNQKAGSILGGKANGK